MKLVIGVRSLEHSRPVIDLVARLKYPDPELHLVHVIESPAISRPMTNATEARRNAGKEILRTAEAAALQSGVACKTVLLDGFAANELMRYAEENRADLIAVNSHARSEVSALVGSTTRKLVIGAHTSLLIVKNVDNISWTGSAIFATDHSTYAETCVDTLVSLAPRGLKKIRILAAYVMPSAASTQAMKSYLDTDLGEWIGPHLTTANDAVRARLASLTTDCDERSAEGETNDVIREEMAATSANLLIIGAKGHGIVRRLVIGSTSLHQALAERYSVLILRAGVE